MLCLALGPVHSHALVRCVGALPAEPDAAIGFSSTQAVVPSNADVSQHDDIDEFTETQNSGPNDGGAAGDGGDASGAWSFRLPVNFWAGDLLQCPWLQQVGLCCP